MSQCMSSRRVRMGVSQGVCVRKVDRREVVAPDNVSGRPTAQSGSGVKGRDSGEAVPTPCVFTFFLILLELIMLCD